MIVWLLLGVVLAIALILVVRGFAGADPKAVLKVLRWLAFILGGAIALLLVVSGRAYQAMMLVGLLWPIFVRWKALWNRMKGATGPTPGQSSGVQTAYLDMQLDHDSGQLDGAIKQGRFSGRRLGDLSVAELVELMNECLSADPSSVSLIEAFLDRAHPEWREAKADVSGEGGFADTMTPDEARRILEVGDDAGEDAIKDAHRKLMMRVHPDQGGSTYLAAKINQAKGVLLKKRR